MSVPHTDFKILERFKKIHGVTTDTELAKLLGKSSSSIHNWRKRGNIPLDECVTAAREKGVSLDWLMLGVGEPPTLDCADDEGPALSAGERIGAVSEAMGGAVMASIPMYDVEGAAGAGRSLADEEVHAHFSMPRYTIESMGLPVDSAAGVRVRGDSMDDTLADGDWVLVDLSQRDPSTEGVFLVLVDGERRIKRMQRVAGGGWLLISDNKRYEHELISPEKQQFVEVLGRCVMRLGQVL